MTISARIRTNALDASHTVENRTLSIVFVPIVSADFDIRTASLFRDSRKRVIFSLKGASV